MSRPEMTYFRESDVIHLMISEKREASRSVRTLRRVV